MVLAIDQHRRNNYSRRSCKELKRWCGCKLNVNLCIRAWGLNSL